MLNYLNALGLILDIIGAGGLFYMNARGKWSIGNPSFNNSFLGFGVANQEQEAIKKMQTEINNLIENINATIKKSEKKSLKWFCFIISGFVCQFLSLFFSNVSS